MKHLALVFLVLVCGSVAGAQTVDVLKNVNLRHDPSSSQDEIRRIDAGEQLELIRVVAPGAYWEVRTSEGEVGFAYAKSGRMRIRSEYRRKDWGSWADADGDCQKARDEVLIAESEIAVTFKPRNDGRECKVTAGRWTCPFTGEVFTDPGALDIDHMVPLRNAHLSGASDWDSAKKARYYSNLDDPEHLIAVKAGANRSKSARGPEAWKPKLGSYHCQYANDWEAIKGRWDLSMTPAESAAVGEMQATCP